MKKIMFNDKYGLTKAVLEGRKTMTRRIIPKRIIDSILTDFRAAYYEDTLDALGDKECIEQYFLVEKVKNLPFKVGEVVAVAQAYKDCVNEILVNWEHKTDIGMLAFKKLKGWINKMFVRADLMPHQIRITGVRVERLQDISDEDCLREGIRKMTFDTFSFDSWKFFVHNPREAFAALIYKVSGKGIWKSNPWVYVYEFELVKKEL